MRLQSHDALSNTFTVCKASYHDQARSNLIMDFEISPGSGSIRSELLIKYGSKLPPLETRELANTIGVAVLIFYRHNDSYVPYLLPRSAGMPVFPGGWHCSASGAVKWPNPMPNEMNFDELIMNDLYEEIREEIGLFKSALSKREHLESDPKYIDFKKMVSNLDGEDLTSLRPIAFCRELLRGGKPQFFFVGVTPLSREELRLRRIMASNVARKMGAREEIDQRLINLMSKINISDELDYDKWSKEIHKTGYTFELLPLLYYASKISIDALAG